MSEDQALQIVSLNIGMPIEIEHNGKPIQTGIYKQPVTGEVYMSKLQLSGDGQGDTVHHGGADKAVCVYPYEHYPKWEQELGKQLDAAAFGENLTTTGLLEHEVFIGDTYRVGEAIIQVSQPRFPCFKLSKKHDVPQLPARVLETGYSGFYVRVLQEGWISAASPVELLDRHWAQVTVAEVLGFLAAGKKKADYDRLRELVQIEALAGDVRDKFKKWIEEQQLV